MNPLTKKPILTWLKYALSSIPWIASMYLLYYFGKSEIWGTETSYRDIMTIAILLLGMGLSFAVQSYFIKQDKRSKN